LPSRRKFASFREGLGDLDRVPKEDPRRLAFGRLHGFSVLCLIGEIVFGALAMGLSVMMLSSRVG
jgi:hypothetical protein